MEFQLIDKVLNDPAVGWIGWSLIIMVLIVIALAVITKWALMLVENLKKLKVAANKKPDYKKQIKCESNINQILRTIKHDLHADSVIIMQYHNGVHSIADNSLLRISATHESTTQNSVSHLRDMDGWMASFLGEINESIFEGRYITLESTDELNEDVTARGFKQYLDKVRCKSLYLFPLQDPYGLTFGVGMVCYTHKPHLIHSDFLKWASGRFHAIGALLAGSEKK